MPGGNWVSRILNTIGYYKVSTLGGKSFYSLGGIPSHFWGEQSDEQYLKDFIEIPELNAIINFKARCESMVKIQIVSKETGKPVKNNEQIVKVLRRPNWFQSQKEWLYQASLFRSIFGNEYHYFLTPSGMGTNYKAIYNLPPQHVFIRCANRRFFLESKMPDDVQYKFILPDDQTGYDLKFDDILHLNNNRVTYIPDDPNADIKIGQNYLYGTSKIASLTPNLKNIRLSYEGRYSLRDLPAGVLSNTAKDPAGVVPMEPKEKESIQGELKNKYGLSLDKFQLILTGLSLRLNETIVDIGKLKLYEEIEEDTAKICDAFGIPFELIGSKTGITYENKKQAQRQLFENTTIPDMAERIEAINYKIETDKKSWEIIGSFDHLPIFQQNMNERSQALQATVNALNLALQSGAITIDDYKKELAKFGIGEIK